MNCVRAAVEFKWKRREANTLQRRDKIEQKAPQISLTTITSAHFH